MKEGLEILGFWAFLDGFFMPYYQQEHTISQSLRWQMLNTQFLQEFLLDPQRFSNQNSPLAPNLHTGSSYLMVNSNIGIYRN